MRDPAKRRASARSYYERHREERKASSEDTARAQRLAEIRARNGAKMRAAMGIA